jgi:hypothetical protein
MEADPTCAPETRSGTPRVGYVGDTAMVRVEIAVTPSADPGSSRTSKVSATSAGDRGRSNGEGGGQCEGLTPPAWS